MRPATPLNHSPQKEIEPGIFLRNVRQVRCVGHFPRKRSAIVRKTRNCFNSHSFHSTGGNPRRIRDLILQDNGRIDPPGIARLRGGTMPADVVTIRHAMRIVSIGRTPGPCQRRVETFAPGSSAGRWGGLDPLGFKETDWRFVRMFHAQWQARMNLVSSENDDETQRKSPRIRNTDPGACGFGMFHPVFGTGVKNLR